MSVTVIPAGGGEVIGDAADRRVEILSSHDTLHATWSRFAPGRDGADLHVHHEHTDLFYVLEGEFTLRLGPQGEERRMPAGTLACMPPGVVHGFRNGATPSCASSTSTRPARLRQLHARPARRPPGRLRPAGPAGGRRAPISLAGFGDRVDLPGSRSSRRSSCRARRSRTRTCATEVYVLEGDVCVNEERAQAGAWVHVAPGEPHTLEGSARFLVIHTPA